MHHPFKLVIFRIIAVIKWSTLNNPWSTKNAGQESITYATISKSKFLCILTFSLVEDFFLFLEDPSFLLSA